MERKRAEEVLESFSFILAKNAAFRATFPTGQINPPNDCALFIQKELEPLTCCEEICNYNFYTKELTVIQQSQ